jgi:hypothetical protein
MPREEFGLGNGASSALGTIDIVLKPKAATAASNAIIQKHQDNKQRYLRDRIFDYSGSEFWICKNQMNN